MVWQTSTTKRASSITLLLAVSTPYVLVAYASPGYDDEFYNIWIVEPTSIWTMIDEVIHEDVNPAGQYVINYLLNKSFNSWSIARVAGGLAAALAVWGLLQSSNLQGTGKKMLGVALVALNPSLLLWCTGLRWLTYFTPLLLFTLIWIRWNMPSPTLYWSTFSVLMVGMFHLDYLAILLAPPLIALAL